MISIVRNLRDALRDLSGRRQDDLVRLLVEHIRVTRTAVDVAREAATATLELDAASARIDDLEADGDNLRGHLVRALSQSLVLPIDREDLFRLSRTIDDVLDDLRDFCRELEHFGAQARWPRFGPVFDAIAATMDQLDDAVGTLARDPSGAMQAGLGAKRSGKEIRLAYQSAIAELLDEDVDRVMLKRRELLRRLDAVGISISEATDALADGGLKRGL